MKCKREQGRGNMEVSEDTKRGLYSKSLPWLNAIDDYWMSKIYLEHVNLNLTKTAEHGYTYRPLQKRAIININIFDSQNLTNKFLMYILYHPDRLSPELSTLVVLSAPP